MATMTWMSQSCVMAEELTTLDRELGEMESCNATEDEVQKRAQAVLARLPAPESVGSVPTRARVLCLRCRAQLLLSHVSVEAERDCHAALKLNPDNATTWILLSECLLRRNACKDACDALDSALRLAPTCTAALCQYSQVQRNRCSERDLTLAQRTAYLHASVEKARSAIRTNMNSGYAWYMLSLALLAMMTVDGVSMEKLSKALAAIVQAERRTTCCVYNSVGGGGNDPRLDSNGGSNRVVSTYDDDDDATTPSTVCENADVIYNKAVIEGLLGYFGDAAVDYARAHALDSLRLKGTRYLSMAMAGIVEQARNRMKNVQSIGKREFVKLQARLSRWQSGGGGGEDGRDSNKPATSSRKSDARVRRAESNGGQDGGGCDSDRGGADVAVELRKESGNDRRRRAFVVIDVLSKAAMQPLILLVSDVNSQFSFVLIYEVNSTLFKIGDVISLPTTQAPVQVCHHIPRLNLPDLDNEELTLTMRHYYTVRDQVQLNNKALPSSAAVPLQMSSRLFA